MGRPMSDDEARAFLLTGPRTAKLAVVRKDGRPWVAPVWFVFDGDDLLFTTWHKTIKAHAMRRDPRVTLIVDDEVPPFSWVRVEGTAALSDDLDALRRWATVIGGRYMGADQAEAFGARNAALGELLVRVTVTKVTSEAGVAE